MKRERNRISTSSIKANYLYSAVRVFAQFLVPVLVFPYVSRVLFPLGIGRVNFMRSFVQYFVLMGMLGIPVYATREAARLRDDREELSRFASEMVSLNVLLVGVAAAVMLLVAWGSATIRADWELFWISAPLVLVYMVGMEWLLDAREQYRFIAIRQVIIQGLFVVGVFLFVRDEGDVPAYAALGVFTSVAFQLTNAWANRGVVGWRRPRWAGVWRHFKPALTLFAVHAAVDLYIQLDTIMLGYLDSVEAVGYYTAANKLIRLSVLLLTATGAVLLPRNAYYVAQGRMEDFERTVRKSFHVIFWIALPAIAGLSVLAPAIVELFSGSRFLPAVPLIWIMSPLILIMGLSNLVVRQVLIPTGNERTTAVAIMIGVVVNVAVNAVLIPRYGFRGAGFASIAAELTVVIVAGRAALRYVRPTRGWRAVGVPAVATAVMVAFLLVLLQFLRSAVALVLVGVSSGAAVYAMATWIMRDAMTLTALRMVQRRLAGEEAAGGGS